MRAVEGSFGTNASVWVSADNYLVIEGPAGRKYRPQDVQSIAARVDEQRKFGVIGAVIGVIALGWAGLFVAGPPGMLAGVVLAVAGSFYKTKKHHVDITFKDGRRAAIQCSEWGVKKLMKFASSKAS